LADLQQTVFPHKWSPISCRSSAGQGKFAGQRPTFYQLCHRENERHSLCQLVPYVRVSPNCVFTFSFLALVVSEIIVESLILIRGPCAPMEPLAEKMYIRNEYLSIANCVFKFNFLSLVVSKITGGPKLTLGRALRPLDAPSAKFLIKRVLYHI